MANDTEETRFIHAKQAQFLFDKVSREVGEKGMKLNAKKTTLLCMSTGRSYHPQSFIRLGENDLILSG